MSDRPQRRWSPEQAQPLGQDGLGPWLSHASTHPKDKIYAAIVDENGDQRSLMWRFTTNKDDLYGGGPGMGEDKLSLHGSGICHWADTKGADDGTRYTPLRWTRPPTPEDKTELVFFIHFPGDHLRAPTPLEVDAPLLLKLPCPGPGETTQLGLFYSRLPPAAVHVGSGLAREYMAVRLANGDWVYLVPRVAPFTETLALPMQVPASSWQRPEPRPTEPFSGHMHLFCGPNESGVASVIELCGLTVIPSLSRGSGLS